MGREVRKLVVKVVLLLIMLSLVPAAVAPGASRSLFWLTLFLVTGLCLSILRSLGEMVIGRDAMNRMVAALGMEVVRAGVRLAVTPLRAIRGLLK